MDLGDVSWEVLKNNAHLKQFDFKSLPKIGQQYCIVFDDIQEDIETF